ncbi:MAG: hypothetical protein WBM25_07930 [Azonexus sp.]|jgi:hypothetical protein
MASIFIPVILPEHRQRRSAPPATRPATTFFAAMRRTMAAHFVAHPLSIFLRHLLHALAVLLTHPLPIFLRRLPPLFAHFLTHLAALVGRQLRMHGPRGSRKGCQHEQQTRHPSPGEHLQYLPFCTDQIVASLCRAIAWLNPGLCNNLFPSSPLKKLVTIDRMPTVTAGLSFAP